MFNYFFIFIFLILVSNSQAENKEKIIENLQNIQNLNFEFEQNINEKIETGNCTINYPKKIFCKYFKNNNKVLVSNGKSLVVKTRSSFYRYPLKKTPLDLILDKNFLIKKIYDLDEKVIDDIYINFTISENNNEINIFFDKKNLNLVGWQTEDIYQNLVITFISNVKLNQNLDDEIFKLPKME